MAVAKNSPCLCPGNANNGFQSNPAKSPLTAVTSSAPEYQMELVALMWLGRSDYAIDEWEDALNDARDAWTPRTAEYLAATPLVADYLQEGLWAFGFECDV